MNSFFDDAETVSQIGLTGISLGRPDVEWHDRGFLQLSENVAQSTGKGPKVGLVSGGGSGHEPLHAGFIGNGMLDAVCPGHVFTSPNARQIKSATRAADQGAGVVHIVKNYTGDVMNFGVASRMAADEGHDVETVLVDDDIATETDGNDSPGRRGTAAAMWVEKVCGAAAAQGRSLKEVAELGRRANSQARSIAVTLSGCHVPGSEESFTLDRGDMEFGVGIHGEPGISTEKQQELPELLERMLTKLLASLNQPKQVALLVNNLGGIAELEISAILVEAARFLGTQDVELVRIQSGAFTTAWDMRGFSLSLMAVDEEMLALLDAPTDAPAWQTPVKFTEVPQLADATASTLPTADSGVPQRHISAWVERVMDSIHDLTELDRKAGDGDFGINMRNALGPFELPLKGTPSEVFHAISESYLVRAGGTSGAVFGIFFEKFAQESEGAEKLADIDLSAALRASTDAVMDLGGAKVGDCTVVDALVPGIEKLEETGSLEDAAEAALKGAEDTANYAASKGRASYVGDKSKGVIDPGALVMAWLFEGLL